MPIGVAISPVRTGQFVCTQNHATVNPFLFLLKEGGGSAGMEGTKGGVKVAISLLGGIGASLSVSGEVSSSKRSRSLSDSFVPRSADLGGVSPFIPGVVFSEEMLSCL
jgi:hypothetical protein